MGNPDSWSPVRREKPKIDAASPPGRVRFSCELTAEPPVGWIGFFKDPQVQSEFPPDDLQIRGSNGPSGFMVTGECAEEHFEKCITNIDGRIQSANAEYEEEIIPQIVAANERTLAEQTAHDQRIQELQRRADRL